MELPALKLPIIDLPFDIPVLLHPPLVHFAIAIPVLVFLIEIINLVVKKRAIGVTAFFILILGFAAASAAYLTGITDGKTAFDTLSAAGQTALKGHEVFGTYLVLASAVLIIFKMLSAMIQRGLVKASYLLVLLVFTVAVMKQGKDGAELVYQYGANVKVSTASAHQKKEDVAEEKKGVVQKKVEETKAEVKETAGKTEESKEITKEVIQSTQKKAAEIQERTKEITDAVNEKGRELKESVDKAVEDTVEKVSEMAESTKKDAMKAVENVKKELSETAATTEEEAVETQPASEAESVSAH